MVLFKIYLLNHVAKHCPFQFLIKYFSHQIFGSYWRNTVISVSRSKHDRKNTVRIILCLYTHSSAETVVTAVSYLWALPWCFRFNLLANQRLTPDFRPQSDTPAPLCVPKRLPFPPHWNTELNNIKHLRLLDKARPTMWLLHICLLWCHCWNNISCSPMQHFARIISKGLPLRRKKKIMKLDSDKH